jgi:hypothetical protein
VREVTFAPTTRLEGRAPELWGFPPPGRLPQLSWIGPDYVSILVHDLARGLQRQDPGTQVMGVRCDAEPTLRTSVGPAGVIRGQDVVFALQIFVCDGGGRLWRLRGRLTYVGRALGTARASVSHYWELFHLEGG